jgi:hypothetical protein
LIISIMLLSWIRHGAENEENEDAVFGFLKRSGSLCDY